MSSIFSENLRIQNALNLKDSISALGNTRYFFTVGKVTAWANTSSPDQANTSVLAFNEVWNNMIGAKLLTGNDVKTVTRRIDWSANTVYDAYSDKYCSRDLLGGNVDFYILTSDWNVYKCLSNNRSAMSTVMPTQIFTNRAIEESDGYIWKYMYTIAAADQLRFTTSEYMPVKTLSLNDQSLQWQVQYNSVEGAIEAVELLDVGENYTNANNITITISGDGTGANAIARVNATSNTIEAITITNKGRNFTHANVVITDTGAGANAVGRAVISPKGGHGSDPLRELGGTSLILNPRIQGAENGKFALGNDYRQIAIITDPLVKSSGNATTNTAYNQLVTIILNSSVTNYELDEVVYQGGTIDTATFKGIVTEWDSANATVKVSPTVGDIEADVLVGANSGTSRFVESFTDQELQPYSGNLIYIDNILPITRSEDQIEDFKILLKF